ncbi:GTP-binding protein [Hominifimenecus sp. rT4P-3]|uniref:GTP-binding protein n=1 Tax=Hominifimenecus sp. rT4P-3 TaxID=3242979 RepID=UPI003DA55F17
MTKVDIVSGFLGAGKTTFIKKLVSEVYAGEKLVLIENEFGEIGIDGGFLREAGIQVTEMNSGCICCTLVGDFSEALKKVLAEYHPDRVLIEPSGVGKLSDVAKAVEEIQDGAEIVLGSLITVVDGKKAKMYMKNFGEFFNNQVEYATTIVLSRTQMMNGDKLDECVHLLKEKNGKATLITTPWESLSGESIRHALEHSSRPEELIHLEEEHDCCGHDHHHEEECGCPDHHHEEHEHDHHHGDHDCGHHHGHEEHEHGEHDCEQDHGDGCRYHHEYGDEGCKEHHSHEGHEHEEHGCEHHHDHEESGCGHHHDHEESGCGHHHDHEESGCEHHHDHHGHDCGHDHHHDHSGHHHHHADEVFTSWGVETAHSYSRSELEAVLKDLAETKTYGVVLRAKGIVAGDDGNWMEFDLVPMEYQIRSCQPDYTGKLCVIGTDLAEDALKKVFHV